MSERGPRFELGTSERFAREAERMLRSIEAQREHEENPLTPEQREVLEKVLLKLDLKRQLNSVMRDADDISIYQPMKKIGLLLVFDRTVTVPWSSADGVFNLAKGDSYIDVHLPPVSEDKKTELFTHIRRSFELLARYIQEQKLTPKYVMGVTYEKLADVTRRYGFTTTTLDIPQDIREGVERVYERFRTQKDGESMGEIRLCYQETADFMNRFSKN